MTAPVDTIPAQPGIAWVPAHRIQAGTTEQVTDALTVEAPLQLMINRRPFVVTMRTPGDDHDLVRGLLYSERVVTASARIRLRLLTAGRNQAVDRMHISMPQIYVCESWFSHRSASATAACGICGQRELQKLKPDGPPLALDTPIPASLIADLPRQMRQAQSCFAETGGSHAAAIFDTTGALLTLREDIGRHNAVDKAIGSLLAANTLDQASILCVSGRTSYEIVTKAFVAGIPIVMGISAPSSLAVSLGERCGMAILGYCREARATIYSNPDLIQPHL